MKFQPGTTSTVSLICRNSVTESLASLLHFIQYPTPLTSVSTATYDPLPLILSAFLLINGYDPPLQEYALPDAPGIDELGEELPDPDMLTEFAPRLNLRFLVVFS